VGHGCPCPISVNSVENHMFSRLEFESSAKSAISYLHQVVALFHDEEEYEESRYILRLFTHNSYLMTRTAKRMVLVDMCLFVGMHDP